MEGIQENNYVRTVTRLILWAARGFGGLSGLAVLSLYYIDTVAGVPPCSFQKVLPLYIPVVAIVLVFFGLLRVYDREGHSPDGHLLSEPVHLPVIAVVFFLIPHLLMEQLGGHRGVGCSAIAPSYSDHLPSTGDPSPSEQNTEESIKTTLSPRLASTTWAILDRSKELIPPTPLQVFLLVQSVYLSFVLLLLGYLGKINPGDHANKIGKSFSDLFEFLFGVLQHLVHFCAGLPYLIRSLVLKAIDPMTALSYIVVPITIHYRLVQPRVKERWHAQVDRHRRSISEFEQTITRRASYVLWSIDSSNQTQSLVLNWIEDVLGGILDHYNKILDENRPCFKRTNSTVLIHSEVFDRVFHELLEL